MRRAHQSLATEAKQHRRKEDNLNRRLSSFKTWWCESCKVEVYQVRCRHCGKSKRERT